MYNDFVRYTTTYSILYIHIFEIAYYLLFVIHFRYDYLNFYEVWYFFLQIVMTEEVTTAAESVTIFAQVRCN